MTPGKLRRLRRLASAAGTFNMLAVDQRPPIKNLVSRARGSLEADHGDVASVKRLLVQELGSYASAVLLDPHYSYPSALGDVSARQGLLLTLEDSVFHERPGGRTSRQIDDWSVDQIARTGADAVKLLAWYRPDADDQVNAQQQRLVRLVGEECRRFDIPFLFELLTYPLGEDSGSVDRASLVIESVEAFADPAFGIDVFKLESPVLPENLPDVGASTPDAAAAVDAFTQLNAACPVPWVMLSAGATKAAFLRVLRYAFAAGASGFLAGRAIWWDELGAFPDLDAARTALRSTSAAYFDEINRLAGEAALPFEHHESLAGTAWSVGAEFRSTYLGVRS